MGDAQGPSPDSDLLQAYLAGRDAPCPVCGYNLRGLDSQKCPECGARLTLRIGADVRLGPWIAALLGMALPLGFLGMTCLIFLITPVVSLIRGEHPEAALFVAALVSLVFASGYGIVVARVVRSRSRFLRQSRSRQVHAAIGYAVSGPFILVLLYLIIVYGLVTTL